MKLLVVFEHGHRQSRDPRDLCLARLFRDAGIDARFVYRPDDPSIELQQRQGVNATELPLRGRMDFRSIRGLGKIIREFAPGVIHAYNAKIAWQVIAAQWPRKKAKLVLNRGAIRPLSRFSISDRLIFFGNRVDAYDCVSNAVAESLVQSGVPRGKTAIVYPGFKPEWFGDAAGKSPAQTWPKYAKIRLGTIANYRKVKGLEYLVDAVDLLISRGLDCELVVVGRDEQRELAAYVARSKSRERIRLTGHLAQPSAVLRTFDCMVIPSLSEGLSQVAIESLVSEVPIVGTRVGGLPEVIEHGVNGWLVEPANAGALADAIFSLLLKPELCAQFRENGRRIFREKFSMERMSASLVELYLKLAKTKT